MTKNMCEISVIMCCYNAEKYIMDAISSILCQTFTNFELIIWNDGSNDKTEEIINKFTDERIRYFYDSNHGIGYARNKAYSLARGKYIACMDSDDVAYPDRLERQYDFLEKNPDCVVVSSGVRIIDEHSNQVGYVIPCSYRIIIKKALNFCSSIVNPASMIRKDAYIQSGGFLPIPLSEDWALFYRMSKLGSIYNLRYPCLQYRYLGHSLSHSLRYSPYIHEIRQLVSSIVRSTTYNEFEINRLNEIVSLAKVNINNTVLEHNIRVDLKNYSKVKYYLMSYVKDIWMLLKILRFHIISFINRIN